MEIALLLLLIVFNGFFSMSEVAMISVRKSSLKTEAQHGSKSALAALKLAEHPENFLSTIQVFITLIDILTGLFAGEMWARSLAPILEGWGMSPEYSLSVAHVAIVVGVTYLSIVFGELVPKRIGLSSAEKISKFVAAPVNFLSFVIKPFIVLLSKSATGIMKLLGLKDEGSRVTEDEIKSMIREGTEDGEVQQVEQDIMERVFSLGDRELDSIMTPRMDIEWIDIDMTKEEIKELISSNPYSKFPVGKEDLDHVEGMVYVKDIFIHIDLPDFDIRQQMRPIQYFYESMEVYSALEQMKLSHDHSALIIDEFGVVQGMVTLKDIMEAIVGEIPEPHEDPEIMERPDGTYLVDGQCSFYNFLSYFKLGDLYPDHEHNTLSGLIMDELGRIPHAGERLEWQDFSLEIVDMDGARIDKVLVEKQDSAESE
ncbi:MAG: hemolysin family protein [Candidatus Symbiothrix sp.]|jgi:putative hemolysin|nr:hemolysin family protein [Candidatus Symbiothrix sp.]